MKANTSEHDRVMALVEFAAWCCASLGNTPCTVSNKLSAVKYFHLVEVGIEMPTDSPLLKRMISGIKRASLQAALPRRCRIPVALDVLLAYGGPAAKSWGIGGRVLFLCLLLTYFIGARAHEVFKTDSGQVHVVHCLTRGDIVFFDNDRHLNTTDIHLATRVLFSFRGHKGDQSQQGCVLMRTRDTAIGPNSGLEADGGAVALMVELLSYNSTLPESAPISAY